MPIPRFISFIIPAWNEESVLDPTLEALTVVARHLDVPSEVIVADDSSTDRTAEIARQRGARVVSVQHRQISATRNAGAREAQGDLLIFIDLIVMDQRTTRRFNHPDALQLSFPRMKEIVAE